MPPHSLDVTMWSPKCSVDAPPLNCPAVWEQRQGLEGWDPGRSVLTSGRGRCGERAGSGLPQLGVIWALVAGLEGEGGAQGGEGSPLHSLPV